VAKTKRKNTDPVQARLDKIIDLLETLVLVQGRHNGLGREDLRTILRLDASRVSRVTKNVNVPH
jgi:hypothetical protein